MITELLYTTDINAARKEIDGVEGKIDQEFTEDLFVVQLPESVDINQLTFSTNNIQADLSPVSRLAYNAWMRLTEKSTTKDFAADRKQGIPWDTEGFDSPKGMEPPTSPDGDAQEIQRSSGTPTSLYMTGSVAVGLVIVSGPGHLAVTPLEQELVIREVQEGLQFLATEEPRAKLSFVYDINIVDVDVAAGDPRTPETAESPWRDAALGKMGFSASRQGSLDYVAGIKSGKGTQWAYVAYFTRYPLWHFAYAIDEKLVMHCENDGWGMNHINTVFAHETCHIFGAADEYGNCNCNSTHGYLNAKNNNCRRCAPRSVSCLMDRNELALCQWTRKQIGWDQTLFPV